MEPGETTTEYKLAKWLGIFGLTLQPAAASLATAFPDSKLIACVMAIVGAMVAIAAALGYQIPRAGLKREQMRAETAKSIALGPKTEEEKKSSSPPSS